MRDFAGSGVVHAVGGVTALAVGIIIGPRIGKYTRDGKPNAIPGHDIVIVLTGCFILAFGWFGFNPGITLGASGNGNLRIGSVAVNTMLAGMAGSFGAMLYMWIALRQAGRVDDRQRPAGRSGGDHRAERLRQPGRRRSSSASSPACWSASAVEFVDRVVKVDDPVGAISVHGVNGLWGVISRRPVRRRQEQLRRLLERRQRLRHRTVLRRRGPAGRAVDRRARR